MLRKAALFFLISRTCLGVTVEDLTGFRLTLNSYPQRIVTLAPSLGELTADLLQEELNKIVGVSEYTNYPPALRDVESVGSYTRINLEKVMSLKPDLILATKDGNPKDQILHLRELGLAVLVVENENFSQIYQAISIIAKSIGKEKIGEKLVAQIKRGVLRFRERAKKRKEKSVLFQIGTDPFVTVGKKSFLNEALNIVGARNVYGDVDKGYPRPSLEDVLIKNPEVILILSLDGKSSFDGAKDRWQAFQSLKAVVDKKVVVVNADSLLRPSIRVLEGLSILERSIYDR